MSAKIVFPSALVLTALSLCAARAQTPPAMTGYPQGAPAASPGGSSYGPSPAPGSLPNGSPSDGALPAAPGPLGPAGLSDYITYKRPHGCCGPVGGDGPIMTEIFLRSGVSIITNSDGLAGTLRHGWVIDGGARSLFFNPEMTAAWAITYGLSNNVYNNGYREQKFPLNVLVPTATGGAQPIRFGVDVPGVTVRDLNQTFVNLGGGRDWWLWGAANSCDGPLWRVGFDFGGRYGSERLRLEELRHRTDVIGGVWFAVHSDLEFPMGCGYLVTSLRAEWNYTWSDILQIQNDSDIMTVNLLVSLGYRF
jgi:hypothetical protein